MDVMWSTVTMCIICTCIRARRVLLRFSKTDYSQCGGPTSKGERRESRERWESRQQQSWRFESQMDPTGRGSIFWFVPMRSAHNQATYSSPRCKLNFITLFTLLVLLSQAWHWPKAQGPRCFHTCPGRFHLHGWDHWQLESPTFGSCWVEMSWTNVSEAS